MTSKSSNNIVHYTRAAVVQPYYSLLESKGVPIREHLAQAGISPNILQTGQTPIPLRLAYRAFNAACRAEGIEDIGLLVGQATSVQVLGELGKLLLAAPTVHEYLLRGCQSVHSTTSGDYYWLASDSRQLHFCQSVTGIDQTDKVQSYLFTMLVTINSIRRAVGEDWAPTAITIPAMSHATAVKLAALLPYTKIVTESGHASLTIPHDVLGCKMPVEDGEPPACEPPSSPPPLPTTLQSSIRQLIETLIVSGYPDIHVAAEAGGMTARTLQRRLAECGTSYSRLVAETRIGLATRWIRGDRGSLTDIAQALGYTDPANFSRAFRRMTGISPRAYRNSMH